MVIVVSSTGLGGVYEYKVFGPNPKSLNPKHVDFYEVGCSEARLWPVSLHFRGLAFIGFREPKRFNFNNCAVVRCRCAHLFESGIS